MSGYRKYPLNQPMESCRKFLGEAQQPLFLEGNNGPKLYGVTKVLMGKGRGKGERKGGRRERGVGERKGRRRKKGGGGKERGKKGRRWGNQGEGKGKGKSGQGQEGLGESGFKPKRPLYACFLPQHNEINISVFSQCQLLPSSTTKMLMLNPLKVLILSVLSLIYRSFPVEQTTSGWTVSQYDPRRGEKSESPS